MSTKLVGLALRARKEARLTNVIQFVDEELLLLAFRSLRKQAAPGLDGQRYEDYAADLGPNLRDLHERLRTGRYRAPVVRRSYIPKADGRRRPLGITTIEDRVVQKAVSYVLSAVYEQDFLACSHGFRPERSAHTALHQLRDGMMSHWGKYVVEVDVAGFFDHVNWEWLRRFLRHRVNDGGLIRLIDKWLRAGIMENGIVTRTTEGTPQGGPASPVLANIYLHYVLDLWFERRFKKTCRQLGRPHEVLRRLRGRVPGSSGREALPIGSGGATGGLWPPDRSGEDEGAAVRREPAARCVPPGRPAGELHLPRLHPLRDEDA
ncbi:MAG: hypothetical protein HY702_02825 [Gemmatimonadetes bacterium]|nr:hypothetical protein [Gemmatimonadota bacterium]